MTARPWPAGEVVPVGFTRRKENDMRRWLAAAVAGAVLFAGGCDSSSERSAPEAARRETPLEAVLGATSRTVEARTSRTTFTMTMEGVPDLPGPFTVTGEGAVDFPAKQGSMVMTVPAVAGVDIGRVDAVFTGTTIYQRFPPHFAALLGGKPWVKVDLAQMGEIAGVDLSSLAQGSSSDPTHALDLLRGVGADLLEVGRERLRGDEVTHYRGTIDPNKAAAMAPPERQAALRKLAELYAQPIPVEVWIDGQGRLRKFSQVLDMSKFNLPAEATRGRRIAGTMSFSGELFDFGTPVSVAIPPPDQVTDLMQLLAARSGSAGSSSRSGTA